MHKVYVEDHIDVGFGDSIVLANEGGVLMVFMWVFLMMVVLFGKDLFFSLVASQKDVK